MSRRGDGVLVYIQPDVRAILVHDLPSSLRVCLWSSLTLQHTSCEVRAGQSIMSKLDFVQNEGVSRGTDSLL